MTYAGAFPEKVSRLVVLDGVTNFPARTVKPADVRIAEWVGDLDKLAQRKIHRYPSVADGAERILARNPRLTREQAMHLATHGLKRNADGTYGWKFDPYLRARAPYRLSLEDHMRAVVAHRMSDASGQRQRAFCPIPRRPACCAFQAGRTGEDRRRGPLAANTTSRLKCSTFSKGFSRPWTGSTKFNRSRRDIFAHPGVLQNGRLSS